MPKYYLMLVDQERGEMYVPVKAFLNPYDGTAAFASGMPQFFGGTDNSDDPPVMALEQELAQESRRSLELTSGSPPHFFTSGNMFFYWADADRWQATDTPWGSAREASEAEMDRIETVDLTQFDADGSNNQLIAELIAQTRCGRAPDQGVADFDGSATREAFVELLRLLLG
ncbi:MAG TPA: hypothetical protein VGW40_04795 [Allosphingosinicella sp.]|nr:hypothetical protein [Allosphingosinicella sp.]